MNDQRPDDCAARQNEPCVAARREWLRAGGRYVVAAGLGGLTLEAWRRIAGAEPGVCRRAPQCAACARWARCGEPQAVAARQRGESRRGEG